MRSRQCSSGSPSRAATSYRIHPLLAVAALLLLSITLGACGSGGTGADGNGSTSTSPPSGDSVTHPAGPDEVVVQVTTGGGFVPVEYNLTLVPEFSLLGDGRVVVPGPIPAIYPGPALPNLQTVVIPEESVQAILSAAREAGLLDSTIDYGRLTITDVGTTVFVVNADGATHRSEIYALGMEEGAGGLTMGQQEARAAVSELRGRLQELTSFVTGGLIWEQYQFTALVVYVRAVDPGYIPDPAEVQPNHLQWPLADLNSLGEEVQPAGFRRVVISGSELETLRPLLAQATMTTLWESGGSQYQLFFRPLLPDEAA